MPRADLGSVTVQLRVWRGFYFDRFGYEQPCVLVTVDDSPFMALDGDTGDELAGVDLCDCYPVTSVL